MKAYLVTDYPGHPYWEATRISIDEPRYQEHRIIKEGQFLTDAKLEALKREVWASAIGWYIGRHGDFDILAGYEEWKRTKSTKPKEGE